jgi:hypothetical protein
VRNTYALRQHLEQRHASSHNSRPRSVFIVVRRREEQRITLIAPLVKIPHVEEIVCPFVTQRIPEEPRSVGILIALVGPAGLARANQAERSGEECVQASARLSVNGTQFRCLPRLRDRPREGAGVRRCGRAKQYAVADHVGGESQGQDGAVLPIKARTGHYLHYPQETGHDVKVFGHGLHFRSVEEMHVFRRSKPTPKFDRLDALCREPLRI